MVILDFKQHVSRVFVQGNVVYSPACSIESFG
jgi:hypothetical protein